MEVLGFTISVLMGVTLGLLGGGGSIFAVPVLVYIFGIDATHSSIYSNFMVGITAGIGFYGYYLRILICFRSAFGFLLPAITSIVLFKEDLIPQLPDTFSIFQFHIISKSNQIHIIPGLLMLFASYSMLVNDENKSKNLSKEAESVYLVLSGIVIGGLFCYYWNRRWVSDCPGTCGICQITDEKSDRYSPAYHPLQVLNRVFIRPEPKSV